MFNTPSSQQEVIATGKMTRIFLQPSIGTNARHMNLAFTPRFAWVDYSEFTTSTGATAAPDEAPQMFIEPAFTTKFRLSGNIHGFCQIGLALPIPGEVYFDYQPLQAAFGIQIDTGGLRTRVY